MTPADFYALRSLALLAALLLATVSHANGKLTVEFVGLANNSGRIACQLLDSPEQFLSREHPPRQSTLVYIHSGKATWIIDNLEFGKYVVSAFHDANANGDLDTGLFGIPTEDYGFSNDARGTFGPPDYEDAQFEFNQSEQTLVIHVD